MAVVDGPGSEVEALRELLSKLSAASLRLNESLEVEAVLQGALDSARALTGAAYGVILRVDDEEHPVDFMSSGMTEQQDSEFWEMPSRWEIFDLISCFDEPKRLDDFRGYLHDCGAPEWEPPFPTSDATAFLGAPVRHQGQLLGAVYVAEKSGGFSAADEDTLVMFASQAALVISNTRRYRDEQQARDDLEAVLDTAPVGVLIFDAASGELQSANREARRLMSDMDVAVDSLQELIGGSTIQRADGQEISSEELTYESLLASVETVRDEEMTVEAPNGRRLTAIVNVTPIRSADGRVVSLVVTGQDMGPLAETERLRAEFMAMIGHELRAPLTSIKGSATTLLQSRSSLDPAETQEFVRIIDQQADHMRGLLADLIDMVQIETGTLSVDPEPAELSRLVDQARDTFAGAGGSQPVRVELPPDLPLVLADARRIVQVLNNLLSNAARHCHDESIIHIKARIDGESVEVSVADNGRGFTADRLGRLFEKYHHPQGQDRRQDLGLGLAICKGIIEAHGGRIWAESEGPGLGSRLAFTLQASDGSDRLASHDGSPGSDRTRVLAVDDDPRELKHIRESLAGAGYEPTVTGNPDEIAELIDKTDPHLVLLDLMLPGTDGIEVMRDLPADRDIPVIFLSAYGQDSLVAKALEMGAADYVVKPFSPTELAARVRAALRARRGPTATVAAPRARPAASAGFKLGSLAIDYAARLVTVAGRTVELTRIEYRLLTELAMNAGSLLTHDELLARIWTGDDAADASRIRTTIMNLRHKLADNARDPKYITTIPHVGYRMATPQQPDPTDT
ncbi:MAG: response regulator [Acidimicrobiaceae bacterium]|nr:response regulator [Acidimicrobiaceae bacterium]